MIKRRCSLITMTLFFVLIFLLIFGKYFIEWRTFLNSPLIPKGEVVGYIFKSGSTVKDLAYFLKKNNNLKRKSFLVWLARAKGETKALKAGEYAFKGPLRPGQLLEQMIKGEVVRHDITFVEGWTFRDDLEALSKAPRLDHTLLKMTHQEIMSRLGSSHTDPEGLFFPDTYQYTMNTTDFSILKKAYHVMQEKIESAWVSRAKGLFYKTPYQALIVASMIEKEARLDQERPLVARVILNRLKKNMYLQIDPTVIYGLGPEFQKSHKSLTFADLRTKSRYNTYKNKGLPPTPIAMPSEHSIFAALHPAKSRVLYFVAKGDGSHYFSRTLKEHNRAVVLYLKSLKLKQHEVQQKS